MFVLPVGDSIMVGTTDIPIQGPPETELTSAEELDYLLKLTNELFPHIELTPAEIDFFYCGVRPLPYVDANSPSAISRGHAIRTQQIKKPEGKTLSLLTLIGGKLTTCRALAEDVVREVGSILKIDLNMNSRDRLYPGGENYPQHKTALNEVQKNVATEYGLELEQVQWLWDFYGTRLKSILAECQQSGEPLADVVPHTKFPVALVRWILRNEWVPHLEGLVNRRLMLLYEAPLRRTTLESLATLMVEAGLLDQDKVESAITELVEYLSRNYGKQTF
ncbi:MAG: glycerol-3-phosphate dehydrogenase C-terminal domain-containing protein [Planctomycetaceae bacterium]